MSRLLRFLKRAARQFPKDSKIRIASRNLYIDLRTARRAWYSSADDRMEARGIISSKAPSYRRWLRFQPPLAWAEKSAKKLSVLIVVEAESAPNDRVMKHLDKDSSRGKVRVHVVEPGAALDPLEFGLSDIVLFVKAGARLEIGSLNQIREVFYTNSTSDLLTFDSDQIASSGRRNPTFRPTWSPESLLSENYVGRAFAMSGEWLAAQERPVEVSDRGLWSLLLQYSFSNRDVTHIPRVLLSEPAKQTLEPLGLEDAAMVQSEFRYAGVHIEAVIENGVVKVTPDPKEWPSVSVLIPTRHSRENISRLVASLRTTDYPRFELIIVDNGGRTSSNIEWYETVLDGFEYQVIWWDEPFNYNKVNNRAFNQSNGDVIVLLNDDTEIVDSSWLKQLAGFAVLPGVGCVGFQLREGHGYIQHGGVVIGPGGFADNLFSGLKPETQTLIGSTNWYRNSLAVTGACLAVSRENYENVGGLDENFILMGSDVAFGLDQFVNGRRNIVIPFDAVRHYESLTRGNEVPVDDLFASYWRYEPWLRNGDPYVSPNVSRFTARPVLAPKRERNPADVCLAGLGRSPRKVIQRGNISEEARALIGAASIDRRDIESLEMAHSALSGRKAVSSVNWFIPDIDSPFFGGLNTAFRIANKLRLEHGVRNRFVVLAGPAEHFFRSALNAAYPGLGTDSEFHFYEPSDSAYSQIPKADAAIATLWLTAIHVAKAQSGLRNFYLIQDFEPEFYPASSLFAMAEESYQLGLYGICNTKSMYDTYTQEYGGSGMYFTPAVDRSVYYPATDTRKHEQDVVTVFAYARDHFRNCWEIVEAALHEVKKKHGRNVRILAAGARHLSLSSGFVNLGLTDYRLAAQYYRESDIGVTMQITRHPSYLPLELMASGAAMVMPASHWFDWLTDGGKNVATTMRNAEDLAKRLDEIISNSELRAAKMTSGLAVIDSSHSDWDASLSKIYDYLCDPLAS